MSVIINIPEILEQARQAIHEAVAADNGTDRQRSAAHHAESLANTILLDPATTADQREWAGYYLEGSDRHPNLTN